ncbi:MAG: hypothetical protein DYG96_08035 [Chlorobi bacterium CHB2]|nr:hypothetical protein [Chlorobi bacterium CHB2]
MRVQRGNSTRAEAVGALLLLLIAAGSASAQPAIPAPDPITAQRVESRKGYVASVPAEAVLDSAASGWNPAERFERRVYRISGVGEFRFTVTVRPPAIPDSAQSNGGYTYVDSDSATNGGTAFVRTYYLSQRSVRIEVIPYGMKMKPYVDARLKTFNSFRWQPGADSPRTEIDPSFYVPRQFQERNNGEE